MCSRSFWLALGRWGREAHVSAIDDDRQESRQTDIVVVFSCILSSNSRLSSSPNPSSVANSASSELLRSRCCSECCNRLISVSREEENKLVAGLQAMMSNALSVAEMACQDELGDVGTDLLSGSPARVGSAPPA